MSKPSVPEDIHSFLRQSIPGYLAIIIALVPVLIEPGAQEWVRFWRGSEGALIIILVIGGPVLGTVIH